MVQCYRSGWLATCLVLAGTASSWAQEQEPATDGETLVVNDEIRPSSHPSHSIPIRCLP